MTAAAFTKALLDLEGNLAPILVSRVSNITIYGRITLESTPFINRFSILVSRVSNITIITLFNPIFNPI